MLNVREHLSWRFGYIWSSLCLNLASVTSGVLFSHASIRSIFGEFYLGESKESRETRVIKFSRKLSIVYIMLTHNVTSYYNSSSVCLFVCLCVPYLLRGPLTDLHQTWWLYVGGPPICPWGVLFRKGQRVDGSTGHFHFPLYYIYAPASRHTAAKGPSCCCRV